MTTHLVVEIFSHIMIFATFLVFAKKRLITYLHAYQQEEYDELRLIIWIWQNKVFDKRVTGILLLATIAWVFGAYLPSFITNFFMLGAMVFGFYKEKDARFDSKKKLAMTARATRIMSMSMLLILITAIFAGYIRIPVVWIIAVQLIPWLMLFGNVLLTPFENMMQQRYWLEANTKLKEFNPITIGITGSFGKTSVKHILGHILKMSAPTLITPGSVNTPMGITRIIREELTEDHKYFICEMGAYGPGSIARLCRLAPPDFGVITAIGHAHYERFKTLDAVAKTKYELAQAVLAKGGKNIVNEKTLAYEAALDIKDTQPEAFVVCGRDRIVDLKIEEIKQTLMGLEITLLWKDKGYVLKAPLFGAHHADNIAYAFACACELGLKPETVITALESVPQIQHRLEVKTLPIGTKVIDDAFNSNPLGFRSALDLLEILSADGGRRSILITPGMVELGLLHDEVHKQIGAIAAEKCDIILVVQPGRIPTFIEGFKAKAANDQQVHEFNTFDEAQKWIANNMTEKDVVLVENDLPDVYERVPKI